MARETRDPPRVVKAFHAPRQRPDPRLAVQRQIDAYTSRLEAAALNPEEKCTLWLARGRLYFINHDFSRALADFVAVGTYKALSFDVLALCAMIRYSQGHHEAAQRDVRQLLARGGQLPREPRVVMECLMILRTIRGTLRPSDLSLAHDLTALIATLSAPPAVSASATAARDQALLSATFDALNLWNLTHRP